MRLEQLEQLYDLAKEEEDKALLQVKQARSFLAQHQQQLEALYHYRREYMNDFDKKLKQHTGIKSSDYQHYHQFLHQLDQAVKKQLDKMPEIEAHLQKCLDHWQVFHQRCKAFTTLMDKRKDEEFLQNEHLEQHMQDEFVTRSFFKKDPFDRD